MLTGQNVRLASSASSAPIPTRKSPRWCERAASTEDARFDFSDDEMQTLLTYLHGLATGRIQGAAGPGRGGGGRGGAPFQPHPATLKLQDGRTLDGTLTSLTRFSATLLTGDGRFHLLSREGDAYSEHAIEPKQDWTSYDGNYTGNRYSTLDQINANNVQRLAPAWVFPVAGAPR